MVNALFPSNALVGWGGLRMRWGGLGMRWGGLGMRWDGLGMRWDGLHAPCNSSVLEVV